MRKAVLLIPAVLVILSAQEVKLFWDGRDWNRLSRQTTGYPEYTYLAKAAYINGSLDGRLYDFFKTWVADSTLADSLFSGEIVDYLTTSEIIRGLDDFYSDPLNRYIPISSAIIIVNMYGEGHSTEMIHAYTEETRNWINNLSLQMQEHDLYRLMEQKQRRHLENRRE